MGPWQHRTLESSTQEPKLPGASTPTHSPREGRRAWLREHQSLCASPFHIPTHLSTIGGFPQQPPKSDGVSDGGQVNVEHSREALRVQGVQEVTGVPQGLPPDVLDKAPKQPPAHWSSMIQVSTPHAPLPTTAPEPLSVSTHLYAPGTPSPAPYTDPYSYPSSPHLPIRCNSGLGACGGWPCLSSARDPRRAEGPLTSCICEGSLKGKGTPGD